MADMKFKFAIQPYQTEAVESVLHPHPHGQLLPGLGNRIIAA